MAKRMYFVSPVEPRVFLRVRTGETLVYDSYFEFIHSLQSNMLEYIGKNFNPIWDNVLLFYHYYEFVVESNGIIIEPAKIKADWSEFWSVRRKINRNSWCYRLNNRIFKYRCDPVPMIHKVHHHKGTYYRRIRTTQERRISFVEEYDGVRWRCRRNFKNLLNSWDEIPRVFNKNWKKFRKHQWKA